MKIAEIYYKERRPDQVLIWVAAALQVSGVDYYANFQPYYENIPHEMMYWALWEKGEYSASKDHFDLCLAYQPFNPKYLHDFRFYYELPVMSFILPTIGRPDGLNKAINSIKNLNYPQDKIEIIVVHDGEVIPDDVKHEGVLHIRNEERVGVPKSVANGLEKAKGDWIIYASNDIEFEPNSIMTAFKTAMDNKKHFIAFNTGQVGPDKGNICEHFMIRKKMIAKIGGQIFDTDFNHVGVDNLLWAKMEMLGQNMRCDRAIVKHNHFSKANVEMDEVYKLGWNEENVKKDRALLEQKLKDLKISVNNGSQQKFNG